MQAPMTLPSDSTQRKLIPLSRGLLEYFPAALAGVAKLSLESNEKHNPGLQMHHAREKSDDHADCILRHLVDLNDVESKLGFVSPRRTGAADEVMTLPVEDQKALRQRALHEVSCLAWRALALSQVLHEREGAPIAPRAW